MRTIFKYCLMDIETVITIPKGKILSTTMQDDVIVVYALVDLNSTETNTFTIRACGTGLPVPNEDEGYDFLGTVAMLDGEFMWHVFYKELLEKKEDVENVLY